MLDVLGIMPTFIRTERDLRFCQSAIESYRRSCSADLLVVDDHSPNRELVDQLATFCWNAGVGVELELKEKNEGFASSVNIGLRRARKQNLHAVLVNADIEFFENNWLDHMLDNGADVVGACLLFPNGLVQHAGIYYSVISRQFDHIYRMAPSTLDVVGEPRICPVTGALQLIRHSTLKAVGLYDDNFKLGYEDVDYCHMVFQAGLKCAYEPKAIAIHHEGMFRHQNPSPKVRQWTKRSWDYLHEKHAGLDFSAFVPTLLEWPDESQ
jgi:GT2 family glycosyltransferase